MDIVREYIDHITNSIDNSNNSISRLDEDILRMPGMTGKKTRHFYNNLMCFRDSRYLEIGTWMGSSVCSAMFGNSAKIVCVDNWSEFDGPKQQFLNNMDKYRGNNDVSFIESDCFNIDPFELPKFNIYLYDGEHSQISQRKALTHFQPCLDDIFIFVVDDWSAPDGCDFVRNGTIEGIEECNLEILYKVELWPDRIGSTDVDGWWNGCCVFLLKKNNHR